MAAITKIHGVKTVVNNLWRADRRFARGVALGLKKGGLFMQRESQLQVPVEFGVLKSSAFTRAEGIGFRTKVTVGYTASYAVFVHEAVGEVLRGKPRTPNPPHKGKYWDPQGRGKSKFLEDPVSDEQNQKQVTRIVRDTAFRAKWS